MMWYLDDGQFVASKLTAAVLARRSFFWIVVGTTEAGTRNGSGAASVVTVLHAPSGEVPHSLEPTTR